MSGRRRKYQPKHFESTGAKNDTSANIYDSMLQSPAFKQLTKNQKLLYVYMKKQYYGKRKPVSDFPKLKDELNLNDECFYFNIGLAEKYGLYTKSNKEQLYKDIEALIEQGLIERVFSGKANRSRSVYRYSAEWKFK